MYHVNTQNLPPLHVRYIRYLAEFRQTDFLKFSLLIEGFIILLFYWFFNWTSNIYTATKVRGLKGKQFWGQPLL